MKNKYLAAVFIMNRRKQRHNQSWFFGENLQKQVNFIVYSVCLCQILHNRLHLRQSLFLALLLIFLFLTIFMSASLHTRLYRYILRDLREAEEGGLQTNQAQISLRRDICSETISQVVICGIIASPTHKCMGVCVRVVCQCVCVCVWHTVVPGVSA